MALPWLRLSRGHSNRYWNCLHTNSHLTRRASKIDQGHILTVIFSFSRWTGPDRVSMDWCCHGSAEKGRMDSPLSSPCSGLFPDAWRPLDLLGGRHEGKGLSLEFMWLPPFGSLGGPPHSSPHQNFHSESNLPPLFWSTAIFHWHFTNCDELLC